MDKEKYERAEVEINVFQVEDVILSNGLVYEDNELPFVPVH